ncbi:TadE family type IV pilus minor pilin [Actinomadura kijaniata]|uniref:TadE family type IV pilus minor pilin n=1 Tax=Actinomadura kijaniata TaxID=46161 RepID=UPI00350E5A28
MGTERISRGELGMYVRRDLRIEEVRTGRVPAGGMAANGSWGEEASERRGWAALVRVDGVRAESVRVKSVRAGPLRDRGAVTAEVALVLPTLVLVTAVALWGIRVASVHLACTDAARSGARAAARGEALPAVRDFVARAIPRGAAINIRRDAVTTRVSITAKVPAPAAARLPSLTVQTHAIAATEPGTAESGPVKAGPAKRGPIELGDVGADAHSPRDR